MLLPRAAHAKIHFFNRRRKTLRPPPNSPHASDSSSPPLNNNSRGAVVKIPRDINLTLEVFHKILERRPNKLRPSPFEILPRKAGYFRKRLQPFMRQLHSRLCSFGKQFKCLPANRLRARDNATYRQSSFAPPHPQLCRGDDTSCYCARP